MYLAHDVEELDRKKLVLLVPFQVLRLRRILDDWIQTQRKSQDGVQEKRGGQDPAKIRRLQKEIAYDIISSINKNLSDGNITEDDANQLWELTNLLHEHVCEEFKRKGGEVEMSPLLPGAIELPNDKYRLRISQLEDKLSISESKLSIFENKLSISESKLSQCQKENAQYKDKIRMLEQHIQELAKKNP